MTTPKNIYDAFETDRNLERDGVEFDCGFGRFKLAYVGNPDFQRVYAEAMKPYAEAQARGLLDPDLHMKILRETYAKTVVKDWSGVIGRDGQEIVFNVENCVKLFDDLPRLFGLVRDWAGNFANYRKVYTDNVVGN